METDINYLYILDYSDSSIYEIELSEDEKQEFNDGLIDLEDIIAKYGCDCGTCSWMTTTDRVDEIESLND